MEVFGKLESYDFGEVHFKLDKATQLRAIVAIHDTRMGPALGGCRFIEYDTSEAAYIDALRLARGMTYKAALAGLAHGGGKSVIMRPKQHFDRVALFRAFGRFIEDLRGHYITAEDSGTGLEDMEIIRTMTKHVTGIDPSHGGSGDPSPFTALGVRRGIEACVKFKLGKPTPRRPRRGARCRSRRLRTVQRAPRGRREAHRRRCRQAQERARRSRVRRRDGRYREHSEVECDVFAPCALGAGAQRRHHPASQGAHRRGRGEQPARGARHGDDLHARGIIYAPDYAINAGGLVNVAQEVKGYDAKVARDKTFKIYDTIWDICERSKKLAAPTYKVADIMVEEKLAAVSRKG